MNRRTTSLMDVLAPPGNTWLREISRRRTDLPAGVHVVRFGGPEDDSFDEAATPTSKSRSRKKAAA